MNNSNFLNMIELQRKSELLLQNLQDEEALGRSILSFLPFGISIVINTSCQEIIHNPISAEIFRVSMGLANSLSNPTPPAYDIYKDGKLLCPKELPLQRAVWNGETICDMHLTVHWPDGVRKYIQTSSCPIYNRSGQIIGALGTVKDITYMKSLEIELISKNKELEPLVEKEAETILTLEAQIRSIMLKYTIQAVQVEPHFLLDLKSKTCVRENLPF